MGQSFQTPFAKPHGVGLSSSTVNVLWGSFNLAASYLLIVQVGSFDLRNVAHVSAVGVGVLAISMFAARHFGQFHGGNAPDKG